MKKSYQLATITKIVDHGDRVKEFYLETTEKFDFNPAQWVKVKIPYKDKTKSEEYTLMNSPEDQGPLQIAVDNHPKSKVGKTIHTLSEGEMVEIKGPYGRFSVNTDVDKLVFVARDIGITASLGNLNYLYDKNYIGRILLCYVVPKNFDPVFERQIKELSEKLDLEYKVLTRDDIGKKGMKKGKIKKKLMRKLFGDYSDAAFYISGNSKFVKSFAKRLGKIDVGMDQVHKEPY